MITSGLSRRVFSVVVMLCFYAAGGDDLWLQMHFVWGDHRVEVEAAEN